LSILTFKSILYIKAFCLREVRLSDPDSAIAILFSGASGQRRDRPKRRGRHGDDLRRAERLRSLKEAALRRTVLNVLQAHSHLVK
jgi:hypothetical protein